MQNKDRLFVILLICLNIVSYVFSLLLFLQINNLKKEEINIDNYYPYGSTFASNQLIYGHVMAG